MITLVVTSKVIKDKNFSHLKMKWNQYLVKRHLVDIIKTKTPACELLFKGIIWIQRHLVSITKTIKSTHEVKLFFKFIVPIQTTRWRSKFVVGAL